MSTPFLANHANKLIASGVFVIVCLLLLIINFWSQSKATEERLVEQQFHLSLENLSQKIDARIASMKLLAKTVANDAHIQDWVASGFAANQESILVEKLGFLVDEYGLTSASFADKNTHKYWNHEGFLRVLKPETDTWYFAYLASEQQDLISVYHDKNKKRVDLYVNYQQTNNNGLSGIATSFNGVLQMLNTSIFAKRGNIYLVDSLGKIQVHEESDITGANSLQDMFAEDIIESLLQPNSTEFIKVSQKGSRLLGARFIPSMSWYVVANVIKENESVH
jgi:methyl-accepting chemotaxis protein